MKIFEYDALKMSYIEAMLWTEGDRPEFKGKGLPEISESLMASIEKDLLAFVGACADLINGWYDQAGHDLWLTRNGHGAGFWDKTPGEFYNDDPQTLTKLTEYAHSIGEVSLEVGDDGLIYRLGGE